MTTYELKTLADALMYQSREQLLHRVFQEKRLSISARAAKRLAISSKRWIVGVLLEVNRRSVGTLIITAPNCPIPNSAIRVALQCRAVTWSNARREA